MRSFVDVMKSPRLTVIDSGLGGIAGRTGMRWLRAYLSHPEYKPNEVVIIAGWDEFTKSGKPLEHVSVSLRRRCPTWDEMVMIKDIFWKDEEMVIQFHPPKSQYVNMHPNCLHLWRQPGWEPDMEW